MVFFCSCEEQDTSPPTVSILSPLTNSTVSEIVTINCLSSDNEGIKKVELWVNGANTGVSDNSEPYELKWNTTDDEASNWDGYSLIDNGVYIITVRAYDNSDNTTDSESITLEVNNNITNYFDAIGFDFVGDWERREYSNDGGSTWYSMEDTNCKIYWYSYNQFNSSIQMADYGSSYGYYYEICENIIHYTHGNTDILTQNILDNDCPCDGVNNDNNCIGDPGSYYIESEGNDIMIWKSCSYNSGNSDSYKWYRL